MYNGVLKIIGLACFFVFCVSVKVKLNVSLLCVCVHSAWKGRRPRNDLYCVGWDVKPYSLTHSLTYLPLLGNCDVEQPLLKFAAFILCNFNFTYYKQKKTEFCHYLCESRNYFVYILTLFLSRGCHMCL